MIGPEVCDVSLPPQMRGQLRVRFAKRGPQAVVSHLEVMSYFHRAFKRADVPAIWTLGMHPRMKSNMSPPIPVGTFSEAEMIDVQIRRPYTAEQLESALVDQLPAGIVVLGVDDVGYNATAIAAGMTTSTWAITTPSNEDAIEIEARWNRGESRILSVVRKGKTRTVDLREVVVSLQRAGADVEVELRTQGGTRLRAMLETIAGADPLSAPGWRVTKIASAFEPVPPPTFVPDPAASASLTPPPNA